MQLKETGAGEVTVTSWSAEMAVTLEAVSATMHIHGTRDMQVKYFQLNAYGELLMQVVESKPVEWPQRGVRLQSKMQ